MAFRADSDSELSRGLAAVLCLSLSGLTPQQVLEVDPAALAALGLGPGVLTRGRTNGGPWRGGEGWGGVGRGGRGGAAARACCTVRLARPASPPSECPSCRRRPIPPPLFPQGS